VGAGGDGGDGAGEDASGGKLSVWLDGAVCG